MSGLNPLSALAAQAALQQQAQTAAIDLGVELEILQQQLTVGDLLSATILPAQDGVDRLSLLGVTIPAQLPPGINPGTSLLLQITGFSGNQILVNNLGPIDPQNPPAVVDLQLPQPASGTVQQAVLTATTPVPAPPSRASAAPAPSSNANPAQQAAPIAPPRSVFVAASVQSRTGAAEAVVAQVEQEIAGDVEQLGVEARIAATRAASIDIADLVTPANPQPPAATSQTGVAAPPGVSVPGLPRAVVPPTRVPILPSSGARVPVTRPVITPRPPPGLPPVSTAKDRPAVAPAAEVALLQRLRVPSLPLTLAAARIASNAAAALPRVLARLEAALAKVAVPDARVASLRTLLGFTARLDPSNARALPEQLAAYVGNFIEGSESKLAAMLRTLVESDESNAQLPDAADNGASANPANAARTPALAEVPVSPAQPAPSALLAGLSPALAARVSERAVALEYDAKAAIASLMEAAPRGAPEELAPALSEALTTITGLQLNALGAQTNDPNAIAIPLPVFYHERGAPVQMRISRDAPGGGKLDADNFSIAFVLDTKSLGTVAIDLQTSGRAVSVSVKTEGATAASRFRSTLDDLRGRLEQLRYRVVSATAGVAPHQRGARAVPAPADEPLPDPKKPPPTLDMRA